MIVAFNAIREIDEYPYRDMLMSLGEYLLMRSELHEFLMANFLHDIGHSPLSHVLEPNPFVELDHEEITRNLILGEKVEKKGMDWYVAERYLLKMKAVKDFEYRFFENRDDPIYDIRKEEGWNENERRTNFLAYLKKNDEILESEIITVSEVLDNFGIDKKRVVEILTGKIFCPKCGSLLKIKGNKVEKCKTHGEAKIEIEKVYDTQFLNKLIHSEIDLDRIDHVKRDSVVCGLSLISFRLLELLGSMSIVLPGSKVHAEILDTKDKPYILISEDGMRYIMDLLTARRTVFKDILYSDENNWINGVVNQITALAVRYLPHLKNMLPYITDQILIHFYTNNLFLGTQIEKLNKLFHDKCDYSAYGNPMRYKLREGVIVKNADLQAMYNKIENINDGEKYKGMALPAVVFYTNVTETKCPVCRGNNLEERECNPNIKAVECKDCNKDEKGDENGGKMLYLVGIEEDIFKLSKCPICGEKIKKRKDFQDVIECEKCGRMRKWGDENWDEILVYGKKFKIDGDEKYIQFEKLVGKYKDALRERFPERPSELDVKNLLYVWISDFVITENKGKEEWKDDIKVEIGGIWAGNEGKEESAEKSKEKIKEFENRFVDLDVVEEGI
jgi:HD superfamily phosphohydrolase